MGRRHYFSGRFSKLYFLELCVASSSEEALNILYLALNQMDIPKNDSEEYYSWEQ